MNFDYLSNKRNYTQLKRLTPFWQRMFYVKPLYSSMANIGQQTPLHNYFIRVLGSLILLKVGWEIAINESKGENEIMKNHKLIQFESEE